MSVQLQIIIPRLQVLPNTICKISFAYFHHPEYTFIKMPRRRYRASHVPAFAQFADSQRAAEAESQRLTQGANPRTDPAPANSRGERENGIEVLMDDEDIEQWAQNTIQNADTEMPDDCPFDQDPNDAGLNFHTVDEDSDGDNFKTDAEKALNMINRIIEQVDDKPGDSFIENGEGDECETLATQEQVDGVQSTETYANIILSTADDKYPDNDVGFEDDEDENNEEETAAGDESCRLSESTDTLNGTEITKTVDAEELQSPPAENLAENLPIIEAPETLEAEEITISQANSQPRRLYTDPTTPVTHTPVVPNLSKFELALMIWEEENNVTRKGHKQLVEVLQLIENLQDLRRLSTRKDTMRHKLHKCLPLLTLRKKKLELDKKLLPSRAETQEDLLAFDMRSFLQAFLSSEDNLRTIHRGLAHLVDGDISEPWEARWWGESIRTTSGYCARDKNNNPLWPSDFVQFSCKDSQCLCDPVHLGRITYVGKDFTSRADLNGTRGNIILEIQHAYFTSALPDSIQKFADSARFSQSQGEHHELVVVQDNRTYIYCNQVQGRLPQVHMDYEFIPGLNPAPLSSDYTVRYFFNSSRNIFHPTRLTTALRGEKEIMVFSRDHLLTHFTREDTISLPMFLFADGFGLFRNMYRSLEGIYLIPQFLPRNLRTRRSNLIPLTLGPFGADLADVFECLYHLCELDSGVEIDIQGKKTFVCSFVGAIIGDMPSQQKLSGCLSHQATKPCRYCLISNSDRANLDFNIVEFGRYGEQMLLDSAKIRSEKNKSRQENSARALGMNVQWRLMDTLGKFLPGWIILY